jgi:transforming growth factor-beta-induced protein
MELFLFCVLSWITHVLGQQSLMQVLSSNLDLVTLYHYVNASASLTNLFSSLNGVTLLAPSNAAFSNLLESRSGEALSDAELQELLQYHILDGNFTTKSWSSKPQFVPTFLKDPKYTNVTGGQVVELITDGHGNPQILSWNKTVSTILTPVTSCIPKILWPF